MKYLFMLIFYVAVNAAAFAWHFRLYSWKYIFGDMFEPDCANADNDRPEP